jgi:hypothetical protein
MSEQEKNGKGNLDEGGVKDPGKPGEPCCGPARHHGHGHDCDGPGWWTERSLAHKIMMGIGFGILGIGLLFLFGWVVMLLWNWLMPAIFGLKRLTYWQAWGLLVLSHILFKGFGPGHGNGRSDRKRRRHLRRYMREEQSAMNGTGDRI